MNLNIDELERALEEKMKQDDLDAIQKQIDEQKRKEDEKQKQKDDAERHIKETPQRLEAAQKILQWAQDFQKTTFCTKLFERNHSVHLFNLPIELVGRYDSLWIDERNPGEIVHRIWKKYSGQTKYKGINNAQELSELFSLDELNFIIMHQMEAPNVMNDRLKEQI